MAKDPVVVKGLDVEQAPVADRLQEETGLHAEVQSDLTLGQ
jgi:hypothetical protein